MSAKYFLRSLFVITAFTFFSLLSACGGGGGGGISLDTSTPPPPETPSPEIPITPTITMTLASPDDTVASPTLNPPPTPTLPRLPPADPTIYPKAATIAAPAARNASNYTRTSEYNFHYGLTAIHAEDAYKRGYFGQGVTIGIIDSGFAIQHPDFAGRIVPGKNFVLDNTVIFDTNKHGTYVALFAAGGIGNPGETIVTVKDGDTIRTGYFHGVAPSASILPLQIGDATGNLTGNSREAFEFAINKVQIVNNSYGIPLATAWKYEGKGNIFYRLNLPYFKKVIDEEGSFFRNLFQSYQNSSQDADIVFVWASGNDGWFHDTTNLLTDTPRFKLCGFNTTAEAFTYNPNDPCLGDNEIIATQQELFDNILGVDATDNPKDIFPDSGDEISRNDPGGYALAPFYQEGLFGKWLVVGATDNNNRLASFSNGCGIAKFWCLVAPGQRLRIYDHTGISGTSFSAPIVSGALAVLKSRLPGMPMEVVRAILLTTATDLGAPGVDNVYGWGLVNLESAINFQGTLSYKTVPSSVTVDAGFETRPNSIRTLGRDIKLLGTNIKLPAGFSHVKNKLAAVEIAVGGVGDAYYNTKLSDLANVEIAAAAESFGDAAADMLLLPRDNRYDAGMVFAAANAKSGQFQYIGAEINDDNFGAWRFQHNFCDDCQQSVWRQWNALNDKDNIISSPFFAKSNFVLQMQGDGLRPFAAIGGEVHDITAVPYQQFGLRWKQSHDTFGYLAEFSQIDERNGFWGADFGALGHTKARTHLGRFALSGKINENWRAHASYQQLFADVQVEGGGILSGISKLRAEGWAVGVEGRDIFWGGDRLRLSARRNAGIQSGKAHLGYIRAEGDFTCAFYKKAIGEEDYAKLCGKAAAQQTTFTQSTIDLAGAKDDIYALGYAMRLSDNTQWAVGAEYETKRNLAAFSAQLQIAF